MFLIAPIASLGVLSPVEIAAGTSIEPFLRNFSHTLSIGFGAAHNIDGTGGRDEARSELGDESRLAGG